MRKKLQTAFQPRQYMLSQDFELYYYEDRALPKVDLHAHNYYEFYFFLEGDVEMQIGEKMYPVEFEISCLFLRACLTARISKAKMHLTDVLSFGSAVITAIIYFNLPLITLILCNMWKQKKVIFSIQTRWLFTQYSQSSFAF